MKKNIIFLVLLLLSASVYIAVKQNYTPKQLQNSTKAKNNIEQNSKHSIKSLNIYSARKEEFMNDLFSIFEKKYSIKINYLHDDAYKLIERLKTEKNHNVADLLILADMGAMDYAKKENLLQSMDCKISKDLQNFFKDSEHCLWAGISFRARVIAYNKNLPENEIPKNYQDLIEDRFKNQIIATPISSPYNQFFIAYLLYNFGQEYTQNWVEKFITNLKQSPNGSDTEKIKSIAHGHANFALVNSYYYLRFLFSEKPENIEITKKVNIIFPNQSKQGTHINLSSIAIINNAKNYEIAQKFIEFLLSEEAQKILMSKNREFSVLLNNNKEFANKLNLENIKFDFTTPLDKVSNLIPQALEIAEQKKWS